MLPDSVLIFDAYNTFCRSFCAYPAMSIHGESAGGVVGFIKSMRRIIEQLKPKKVFVIWEGGGSSKRRSLYSEYKQHRAPGKLNRFYEDDIPDTDVNKLEQVKHLVKLLKSLPIKQVYVSDVEADDVIAYMCKRTLADVNKIIVSTDRDMYQLLDDRTVVYNLNKKSFVTPASVVSEFSIPPRNFALAKTLCGDVSDNIKGIGGVGFKTAAKKFPLLIQNDKDVLLQEIIDYSATRQDEAKIYKTVVEKQELLRKNWRLIYLDGSMIPHTGVMLLENVLKNEKTVIDKIEFIRSATECGIINHFDVDALLYSLRGLHVITSTQNEEKK